MKIYKSGKTRYFARAPGTGEYKFLEITQRITDGVDCYPWREVFAWWPVKTIGNRYVWFRKVYKQRFWAVWGQGFHMEPQVEYAELFDILANKNSQ